MVLLYHALVLLYHPHNVKSFAEIFLQFRPHSANSQRIMSDRDWALTLIPCLPDSVPGKQGQVK